MTILFFSTNQHHRLTRVAFRPFCASHLASFLASAFEEATLALFSAPVSILTRDTSITTVDARRGASALCFALATCKARLAHLSLPQPLGSISHVDFRQLGWASAYRRDPATREYIKRSP